MSFRILYIKCPIQFLYVTCPVNLQFGFLIAFHKVKAPHRHHKRKKLHKAYSCYFHCVAGYTHKCIRPLSPGDPPTSVSPSASPSPISVQNPWPERKDMSHRLLICLIRAARFLSKSQFGKQWLSNRLKKMAHAFPAIRQSVTFITAYYCMSVDPGEQATQHLQLISPVHNSKEKGKTTENKQPFSSFPGDAPASCSCPNGHVPAPGTTTCRSQWCSRRHSDKPGYRAMATNYHHSNGCCACFAFGCTGTGCTTGFGKGFGCTAFGGGAAAASLGLSSEKM